MDLHDKAIVLQLYAFFEELIEKESEKAIKPRKANKKVKNQKKPNNGVPRRGQGRRPAPGVTILG